MKLLIYILLGFVKIAKGEPNFVFILTDDQDLLLDGMVPMTNTINLVANNGKTFQNAYVNTPLCCPSRSTILTGQYIHNTRVVNNSIEGNCSSPSWQTNFEPFSIAAILKSSKNYVNFYAGKYMNQYGSKKAGGIKHIPEGYDWWLGLKGNSKYYNYTLSVNGTPHFSSDEYLTDVLAKYALIFLEQRPKEKPFFMMIGTPAPHTPSTPAERHKNRYKGVKAVRTPAFNHSGFDKHWLVRMPPKYLPDGVEILDELQQHRLETLLAVDELVEQVVDKLKSQEILDNTYLIYMSDNGFHIGQFGQPWDKRQPYETDLRVPFIISGPKIPKKSLETYPISAADVAPTILDLAGISVPEYIEGVSFKTQLFSNNNRLYKTKVFVEYRGEGNINNIDSRCPWKYDSNLNQCTVDQWCKCQDSRNNSYACILDLSNNESFKFCEFYDSEHFFEAYNLTTDPYELKNVFNLLNLTKSELYANAIKMFRNCEGKYCT